jgi:diacylglycerol kinase
VLALEAVNTAVEATVDALPGGWSEDKRHAKDTAAAAVLVGALASLVVAAALFLPRLLPRF